MAVCENCSATLEPQWKYCIHCGTQAPAPFDGDEPEDTDDPGMDDAALDEKKPVSPLFVLGIIFAGVGLTILTIFLTISG